MEAFMHWGKSLVLISAKERQNFAWVYVIVVIVVVY